MLRQRLRARNSPLRLVGRLLTVIFALALIWYGAMLVLLALKVSPDTVNDLSAYRTIYDELASLSAEDITDRTRLITAVAGLAGFVLFGYLAYKELPRPHLTRGGVQLADDERGTLEVRARALERAAEAAASYNPLISSAAGRYAGRDLTLNVHVNRAREMPDALRDVQRRARESLERHELPSIPVNVTLTGLDRQQRRELS